MDNHNIKPDKITKPIQLLAAWLIGLILLVSALLTAAGTVTKPEWLPAFFSISAVAIIPIFLILIFLLQTKFRPQMQEDEYYSKFLNRNTMEKEPSTNEIIIDKLANKIDEKIIELSTITQEQITALNESLTELSFKSGVLQKKNTKESASITKGFQEFIKDTKNEVYFNIKLDKSAEILLLLGKLNIKVDRFFGDNEKQVKPEIFLLSFGANVDFETLKLLVKELQIFGLTHLRIVEESDRQHTIYIGSYAYKEIEGRKTKTALITPQLLVEIGDCSSSAEIYAKILQNMK